MTLVIVLILSVSAGLASGWSCDLVTEGKVLCEITDQGDNSIDKKLPKTYQKSEFPQLQEQKKAIWQIVAYLKYLN